MVERSSDGVFEGFIDDDLADDRGAVERIARDAVPLVPPKIDREGRPDFWPSVPFLQPVENSVRRVRDFDGRSEKSFSRDGKRLDRLRVLVLLLLRFLFRLRSRRRCCRMALRYYPPPPAA